MADISVSASRVQVATQVTVNPPPEVPVHVGIERRTVSVEVIATGGDTVSATWNTLLGKPLEFPPEPHRHPADEIDGLVASSWEALEGKPLEFPPSAHGHVIEDVSGLSGALATKLEAVSYEQVSDKPTTFPPTEHTHDERYYTETETDALLSSKAATAHFHDIADVNGLETALGQKLETVSYAQVTDKPATFAPSAHTHVIADTTGLQGALDGKALLSHTHAIGDTTGLQTALDSKEATGTAAAALSAHTSATDPHTGYQLKSEKAQANGYASLGADAKVPASQLPAAEGATLSDADPLVGTLDPAPGTATEAARADHRHPRGGVYHQRFQSGQFYSAYSTSVFNASFASGILHLLPFFVSEQRTFNAIGVGINGAAGVGPIRLGIYNDNGEGYPGSLFAEYGTVNSASIGTILVLASITLPPGLYWLACLSETTTSPSLNAAGGHTIGMPSISSTNNGVSGYRATGVAAGALPTSFPASQFPATVATWRTFLRAA